MGGIGNRPGIDGGIGGIGNRPGIDGGGIRPGRPTIGGGGINNRPGDRFQIGDNNLINRPGGIGNDINFGEINNNWGIQGGGGNWADHWHDNCIHDHHDWYNGCWNGNWGSNWYAPVAMGAVGWGLGAAYGSWGYGESYYNPYYDTAAVAAPAYDYSQPVVVQQYVTSDTTGGYATADPTATATPATPPAAAPPEPENPAMKLFDEGVAQFKAGSYSQALVKIDGALKSMPKDPVLHEVRALCLFALGRYKEAAATLNALLAAAPGMDWTSMSSLYGNADDYTAQLRKLEEHVKSNTNDPSAMFVLAYHYLVIGQNDAAIDALRHVVQLQPKDATAQRMLASLAPPEEKPAAATPPTAAPPTAAPAGPTTDLVGDWVAKSDAATIELSITEASQFTWRATPKGKPAVEIKGNVATSSDSLVLETSDKGNMSGQVKSGGPDKFTFAMAGMPASDPGLTFDRVRK